MEFWYESGLFVVAVLALGWLPQVALAQHGGGHGGGGGGFHGGGGWAADFMEAEEDSPAATLDLVAGTLDSAVDTLIADTVAGMEAADYRGGYYGRAWLLWWPRFMDGAAGATDGAAEVGAADMVTVTDGAVGAGDLVTAGLTGDMAGAILMVTTAPGITRPTLILLLPTDIPRIT